MTTSIQKLLGSLLLCVTACAANVGTSGSTYVPKDSAATCTSYCAEIGLQLNSVVIMANNVGCVCTHGGPPAPASADAAGAGMATLLLQQQQQQRQQHQQHHHRH